MCQPDVAQDAWPGVVLRRAPVQCLPPVAPLPPPHSGPAASPPAQQGLSRAAVAGAVMAGVAVSKGLCHLISGRPSAPCLFRRG